MLARGVLYTRSTYPNHEDSIVKNLVLVSVIAASLALPITGHAAEQSAHSITGNLGIFSNYIFRGVTQTTEEAALQGGFDYAHASGLYAGTWGSNVSWLTDGGIYTASSMELDVYGGYKGTIGKSDFGYDVGAIYYYYPGSKNPGVTSADTAEIYGAVSWKWVTAKLSYAVTDYFGFVDSKGTYYADLSASYPIANTGVTLMAHVGIVKLSGDFAPLVTNDSLFGYTDWKIGASYALPKDFTVGGYYTDTNAPAAGYTFAGTDWADKQFAVYIQKAF
jgi:uncharacterized protein (TIGR02001 family)